MFEERQSVLHKYPYAWCAEERDGYLIKVRSGPEGTETTILGSGDDPKIAWEDAAEYVTFEQKTTQDLPNPSHEAGQGKVR